MGIKKAVDFVLRFRGDGSDATLSELLAKAPIWFSPPTAGQALQLTFDLLSLAPSGVVDVSASGGLTVQSAALALANTKLDVTFTTPPAANTLYFLYGTFLF